MLSLLSYATAKNALPLIPGSASSSSLPVLTPEGLALQVSDVNADDRSSPTDKHTQKIAAHVSAYIHHVRTQLKQTIPKAIVHCLVSLLALCVPLC